MHNKKLAEIQKEIDSILEHEDGLTKTEKDLLDSLFLEKSRINNYDGDDI